jgi:uncharacterized protein YqgC (DUF456 family)
VLNLLIRLTLAAVSVAVGVAGLILPILPGWLFFAIAAVLLFPETPFAQRVLRKIEDRFPSSKRVLRFLVRDR